jgi:hypothetical protein
MAAVIGTTLIGMSSMHASSKAKKEARRAAKLERLMTAEELRRLGREQQQVLGGAKAQIAGSGFTGYGASTEAYLTDLQSEQAKQAAFTTQVGGARAGAIKERGRAIASSYNMDAFSSLVSTAASFDWGFDSKEPVK